MLAHHFPLAQVTGAGVKAARRLAAVAAVLAWLLTGAAAQAQPATADPQAPLPAAPAEATTRTNASAAPAAFPGPARGAASHATFLDDTHAVKTAAADPAPSPSSSSSTPPPPPAPGDAATPRQGPSFDIRIDADTEVRELLERHLELQRYRAVSDLDAGELERLLVLAREDAEELLGTLGYFSPQVDIGRAEGGARPEIVLRISRGPAAQVGQVDIRFEGDITQPDDEDAQALREAIARDWRLRSGRRFTQDAWDAAKTQALRQMLARRFPLGRISQSLADVDTTTHRVDLVLTLDSGPGYRLGPLRASGLERYDPRLVPRLARLAPGQPYDQRRLVEAQQRLASSGYFDSAFLSLDTSGDPAAAPVNAQLREAKLQRVLLGLGFATDTGPRLSAEHVHNRTPLLGWRAQTRLQVDDRQPFIQTQWTAPPDEGLWRWVGALRLERLDDGALVTQTQRWRAGRTQAGDRIDRNIFLQFDRSRVGGGGEAGNTDSATGEGASLSLNYGWVRRAFDSLPFPDQGQALAAEVGAGTTLDGQRQPYARGLARWTGIVPLGTPEQLSAARRGRLALRLEGGAVGAAREAPIPAAQLFRAGGDTSVRGYGLREIGITLPNGTVGPGRYLATGSVEWQQPLRRRGLPSGWESTLFVDAGQVAERADQIGRDLRVGVGAGARWRSPIGPLQVDLAYGVQVRKFRLHLSVGWVF